MRWRPSAAARARWSFPRRPRVRPFSFRFKSKERPSVRPDLRWGSHQLEFCRRGDFLFAQEFSALINELSHDADGDLRHTLRTNFDSDRTGDAFQVLEGRDFFLDKMFEDGARLAGAADHTQE